MDRSGPPGIVEWLRAAGAQNDVISWAEQHASSWQAFWEQCPRGDWLLGVAARLGVARRQVLEAAAACWPVLEPYLPSALPSVERARQWLQAVEHESIMAESLAALVVDLEADLAAQCDPAANAALMAVLAMLACADDASAGAMVPVSIVQAAVMDAGDCAMLQAARFTEHECAAQIRRALPFASCVEPLLHGLA